MGFRKTDRRIPLLRCAAQRARISLNEAFVSITEMTNASPPAGPLSFQDVLQLVELIQSSSRFSELKLRSGGLEIELRRGGPARPQGAAAPAPAPAPASTPTVTAEPASPSPDPPLPAAAAPALHVAPGAHFVKAPMMGTVYLAPEPGAAPYVRPGQAVQSGQQVCIVEVMKLMNAVHAERAGVVSQVLVADGQAVEFGQALAVIDAP
jgi:acetyl-CoA carboxylase biotin carboxyl carrier protein